MEELKCLICGEIAKSNKSLSAHINKRHKITAQVYYDTYIHATPKYCPICGKENPFLSIQAGYQAHCSSACSNRDPVKKQKIRDTVNEWTPDRWKLRNQRLNETCTAKWGGVGFASKELSEKSHTTCFERHGDANYNNRQQARETCIEHFGYESNFCVPGFQEYSIQRKRELYGNAANYNKTKQTMMELYGHEHVGQCNEFYAEYRSRKYENRIQSIKEAALQQLIEIVSIDRDWVECKCNVCGHEFRYTTPVFIGKLKDGKVCPQCNQRNFSFDSQLQHDIIEFIQSIYKGDIIKDDRHVIYPLELDILIPELKLAFEIDGSYWHSLEYKDVDYHRNKTILCLKSGYRLIHIYEHLWNTERESVKEHISNIINNISDEVVKDVAKSNNDYGEEIYYYSLGYEPIKYIQTYYIYDPQTDVWSHVETLPEGIATRFVIATSGRTIFKEVNKQ